MNRLLLAGALALGVLATGAPAAQACEPKYCWWSAGVCRKVGCDGPILERCYFVPVADAIVCTP